MTTAQFFAIIAIGVIGVGLHALIIVPHLLRKLMALNIVGVGIFLFLIALASRTSSGEPDPVPQAMVLTGIVVSISATALMTALIRRYVALTGKTELTNRTDEAPSDDT